MRVALLDLALIVAGVWTAAAIGTWLAERIERRALRRRALAQLRIVAANENGTRPKASAAQ